MTDQVNNTELPSSQRVRKVRNLFEKRDPNETSITSSKHTLKKRYSLEPTIMNNGKETHFFKHEDDAKQGCKYKKNENNKISHSTGSRVLSMIKRFECSTDESLIENIDNEPPQPQPNPVENNTPSRKKKERKNIRSFVEAEDEGDTEEYRKSLLKLMDEEMAQMRRDGFIDNDEESNQSYEEIMHYKLNINHQKQVDDTSLNTPMIQESPTIRAHMSSRFEFPRQREEFTESLSDDLENGYSVAEAYNDDGRELIIVQMLVDRKPVYWNNLNEVIKNSDFVLYQNDDNTLEDISNTIIESEYPMPDRDTVYSTGSQESDFVPVKSNGSKEIPYRWTNYSNNSCENPTYEYVDILSENRWTIHSNTCVDSDHVYENIEPPSNRSTVYSTTSRESEDDEDEGIGLQNAELRSSNYGNIRRETFCDNTGIVRIERVESLENKVAEQDDVPLTPTSSSMTPLTKLGYIINEIKTTERKYVQDLARIVEVYYKYLKENTPSEVAESRKKLFGNIAEIFRKQKEFLNDLERRDDTDSIVRTFINHEELFRKYPYYFRNRPKADRLLRYFSPTVKKMQEDLNDRLDFSAYLLTPVQRLGKYILFLENILSTLIKLELPIGSTQMALDIMKKEMSKGNDYVAIESIQNSLISRFDYGSLKIREKFNISKPKRVEAIVFLFTNVIVITTPDPREKELFNYFDHIYMTDLRLVTFEDLTLHLSNFTKSKQSRNSSRYTYILEVKDDKTKTLWKDEIESLLWQQFTLVKEKTLRTHTKTDKATSKKSSRPRIKSTGSSIFYVT